VHLVVLILNQIKASIHNLTQAFIHNLIQDFNQTKVDSVLNQTKDLMVNILVALIKVHTCLLGVLIITVDLVAEHLSKLFLYYEDVFKYNIVLVLFREMVWDQLKVEVHLKLHLLVQHLEQSVV
jgi:hypothetical protein